MNEELSARLEELMRPSATDVRRAKRIVMRLLDDGRSHRTAHLVASVAEELGAPRSVERVEVQFLEAPPDASKIAADNTTVIYVRGRIAGRWALAELAGIGLATPAIDPGGGESGHDPFAESDIRIRIARPGGSFSVRVDLPRPALEQAFIRSRLAENEPKWYIEPNIFAEELQDLELDDRALRALREALAAFRRGLYVATASLLGVVSEAAWYRAAERLATPGKLEEAVRDSNTAQVQRLVADRLRGVPRLGAAVDELYSFASFYRELRNYGVHPALVRDDLERYFAEEECGLLIMRTHNYLVRLSAAVSAALQEAS